MNWLGDYPEDFANVAVFFTTHDSAGAPIAPLTAFEAADVKIYKDGDAAQKTSTNGLTMTSPFDSIAGLHRLLIDTSNDTGDSGFWVAGHVYSVVLNPDSETVNGQTALKVLGTFGVALSGATTPPSAASIADAVWDEPRSGHVTSGTFGEGAASVQGNVTGSIGSLASQAKADVNAEADTALADAGVTTTVTGRIDAAISTRLAAASYSAPLDAAGTRSAVGLASANLDTQLGAIDDYIDTEVAAIKAKTDNLPSDPADASDIASSFSTVNSTLSTIAGYIDTEVAAIKAKTDNLPASPAATGDIPSESDIANALLDLVDAIEDGLTPRQALRLIAATVGGKASGMATTTNTFRNAVADDTDRVVATVDTDGNRTAVTYDLS